METGKSKHISKGRAIDDRTNMSTVLCWNWNLHFAETKVRRIRSYKTSFEGQAKRLCRETIDFKPSTQDCSQLTLSR